MRREEVPARSLPRQRLQPDEVTTVSTDELASWLVGIETDISRLEQNRVVVFSHQLPDKYQAAEPNSPSARGGSTGDVGAGEGGAFTSTER